ncbi:hypothetical protein D9M72_582310 [compost metagenome]
MSWSDMNVNCWSQFTIIRSPLTSVIAHAFGKTPDSLCVVPVEATCLNDAMLSASVALSAARLPPQSAELTRSLS